MDNLWAERVFQQYNDFKNSKVIFKFLVEVLSRILFISTKFLMKNVSSRKIPIYFWKNALKYVNAFHFCTKKNIYDSKYL